MIPKLPNLLLEVRIIVNKGTWGSERLGIVPGPHTSALGFTPSPPHSKAYALNHQATESQAKEILSG